MTLLLTARLRLTPLSDGDMREIHAQWTAPGARRYLFDDTILTPQQTAEMIEESGRLQQDEGTGLSAVRYGSDPLVGFAGYWYFRQPPALELVYGVAEHAWGQGIATEAASAMLRYGSDVLRLARVVGSTDAVNVASARVLENLGMMLRQCATLDGLDSIFYDATREQWLAHEASESH
jgi:ribosomal-protein-alanine N-acetyltransferase